MSSPNNNTANGTNGASTTSTTSSDVDTKPKQNPLLFWVKVSNLILFMSLVTLAYEVAIEIKPLEEEMKLCHEYEYNFTSNNTFIPPSESGCYTVLESLKDRVKFKFSFYTIISISVLGPVCVIFLHALVTDEDTEKKVVYKCWLAFFFLIIGYFLVLGSSAIWGYTVFLRTVPVFVGIPLLIVLPLYFHQASKLESLASQVYIPLIVKLAYLMVIMNVIALASYIVWEPTESDEAYRRGSWLLSCAYYFAVLAGIGFALEIHYVYTKYDDIKFGDPDEGDYLERGESDKIGDNQQRLQNQTNCLKMEKSAKIGGNHQPNQIQMAMDNGNQNIRPKGLPILGQIVVGLLVMTMTTWNSTSSIAGNITILVLLVFMPIMVLIADKNQAGFDNRFGNRVVYVD